MLRSLAGINQAWLFQSLQAEPNPELLLKRFQDGEDAASADVLIRRAWDSLEYLVCIDIGRIL